MHYEALKTKRSDDVTPRIRELTGLISEVHAAGFEPLEKKDLSQCASVPKIEVFRYARGRKETLSRCNVADSRKLRTSSVVRYGLSEIESRLSMGYQGSNLAYEKLYNQCPILSIRVVAGLVAEVRGSSAGPLSCLV